MKWVRKTCCHLWRARCVVKLEKYRTGMPRVVSDQRAKYDNDELFRKLCRESEVKYTGFRDRPPEERQLRFQTECREGHADIAFVATGTNLQLSFSANAWSDKPEDRIPTREFVDFEREPGKVHLKSQFIMNGVCVIWRGWIDLNRLDGVGCLEFDAERAQAEDALLREQIEQYNRRLREFEERQRQYRQEQERQAESEAEEHLMLVRHRELLKGEHFQTSAPSNLLQTRIRQNRDGTKCLEKASSEVRTPVPVKPVPVKDTDGKAWQHWQQHMYIL